VERIEHAAVDVIVQNDRGRRVTASLSTDFYDRKVRLGAPTTFEWGDAPPVELELVEVRAEGCSQLETAAAQRRAMDAEASLRQEQQLRAELTRGIHARDDEIQSLTRRVGALEQELATAERMLARYAGGVRPDRDDHPPTPGIQHS
jgi:hypothetical protein